MESEDLSIRVDQDMVRRLDALAEKEHMSRSDIVQTLIEEGLRMAAHPHIVFRSGPAGRRPALADGPDVWEVARVLREVAADNDDPIDETAELTDLRPDQVQTVARYYTEFRDEIDNWIRRNDEEAERAHADWLRSHALLRR